MERSEKAAYAIAVFGVGGFLISQAGPDFIPSVLRPIFGYGGVAVMLIATGYIVSLHVPQIRRLGARKMMALMLMAIGLSLFGAGAAWYLWLGNREQSTATSNRAERQWPIKSFLLPANLLLSLYMTDESNITGAIDDFTSMPATVADNGGTKYKIYCRIYYDVTSRTKYMSIYVPRGENIFQTLAVFSWKANEFLSHSLKNPSIKGWKMGSDTLEEMDSYPFSGRLYMYYEGTLGVEEKGNLARIYRQKSISVEFHGTVFALAAWENIRKGLVAAPPMFKIVHDKITKMSENSNAHKSSN